MGILLKLQHVRMYIPAGIIFFNPSIKPCFNNTRKNKFCFNESKQVYILKKPVDNPN
jgi:hypothetical protein